MEYDDTLPHTPLTSLSEPTEIDDSGTYWVVKAPDHGYKQANVIGFDDEFNYQYGEHGNIYCGNCQRYEFYQNINSVTACRTCLAPFKAVGWFDKHTYQVELNGQIIGTGLTYEESISLASSNRSQDNSIYISFEVKS